jgi:hypothetical protein
MSNEYAAHIITIKEYFKLLSKYTLETGRNEARFIDSPFYFDPSKNPCVFNFRIASEEKVSGEYAILDKAVFKDNLDRAINDLMQIGSNRILIVSNDSFRIWYLLHMCYDDFNTPEEYSTWLAQAIDDTTISGFNTKLETDFAINDGTFKRAIKHSKNISTDQNNYPFTNAYQLEIFS